MSNTVVFNAGAIEWLPGKVRLRCSSALPAVRHFHVRAVARERYGITGPVMTARGELITTDLNLLQHMAAGIAAEMPNPPSAVDLYAGALAHELLHMVAFRCLQEDPQAAAALPGLLRERLGNSGCEALFSGFRSAFPPPDENALDEAALLEELLLLRLHNRNPAMAGLKELISDEALAGDAAYEQLELALQGSTDSGGTHDTGGHQGIPVPPGVGARLLTALEAPQLASPDSLSGQLRYLLETQGELLDGKGGAAERLLLAIDMLSEQETVRLPGPGPGPGREQEAWPASSDVTEVRFARDSDWMADIVITARNCLVWLSQLSEKHGFEISRLDRIPDSELADLAAAGFTGLWLIGIWERSAASRTIKRMRGQPEAEASAYALEDYVIAERLGGEAALDHLRERAAAHGLRLVSDMVPNHTGLDSRWVREHPDHFVQLDRSPYPGYSFTGPDLSGDGRVSIQLEDGYWDGTDAAVVFRRTDAETGQVRFIYHGNDGTLMPWNDTAQLDFLQAEVREAVIGEMIRVARQFPVIRFDAAMTLVRAHVRRLWHPPPGSGGAIPSRSLFGVRSQADFDRLMGQEFWSEAVARIEAEVPGTLLIAEAFWMLEDYFVRHLGMHRVYNSAFMHMLRDGDNRGFTNLLLAALQKDPRLLARYVNFMNNPDEDSAASTFGTGERYLGVCTMLATLPGLPLFGHGQVEGLYEKYGMEFSRPLSDQQPDEALIRAHGSHIFPLLHRRRQFTGTDGFELYPQDGSASGVIAYSNVTDGRASIVCVNNSDGPATARIVRSADRADRPGRTLTEALGLSGDADSFVIWRNLSDGLEYLMPLDMLSGHGLQMGLASFGRAVLVDFTLRRESPELPLREVYARMGNTGMQSLSNVARRVAWQEARRSVRKVLQGKAVRVPVRFPSGDHATAGDVLAVAVQLQRLRTLAGHGPEAVSSMWRALTEEQRFCLRLRGTGGFRRAAVDLLQSHPQMPSGGADWWSGREARTLLEDPDRAGTFRPELFRSAAAALVLATALDDIAAGMDAGASARKARFEWQRMNRAARLSGLNLQLLLAALDVRQDGSGPGQGHPPRDDSAGPDQG